MLFRISQWSTKNYLMCVAVVLNVGAARVCLDQ